MLFRHAAYPGYRSRQTATTISDYSTRTTLEVTLPEQHFDICVHPESQLRLKQRTLVTRPLWPFVTVHNGRPNATRPQPPRQ